MSQHWHNLRIAQITETSGVSEVLAQIAQEDPELAQELAGVNWVGLRLHVMRLALDDAAQALGASVRDTFDNSSGYGTQSGDPARGVCVGVLHSSTFLQLGVSVDGDGRFLFFWNQGGDERHADALAAWKQALQAAFEKRLLQTALEVMADDVTAKTQDDGTFIAKGTLKVRS